MSKIIEYWDNIVKPLIDGYIHNELIHALAYRGLGSKLDKSWQEIAKNEGIKDILAIWYISKMVFWVEHDLGDGYDPKKVIRWHVEDIYNILIKPSYWIWQEKSSSKEAKQLKEIVKILEKIIILGKEKCDDIETLGSEIKDIKKNKNVKKELVKTKKIKFRPQKKLMINSNEESKIVGDIEFCPYCGYPIFKKYCYSCNIKL